MDDEQSLEELEAHYGPSGPVTAASDWLDLLTEGDLETAWPRTDRELREDLARAWAQANTVHPALEGYTEDELTEALSRETPQEHPLWRAFAETQLDEFHGSFGDWASGAYGAASRPRPIPPDKEVVIFIDTRTGPTRIETLTLIEDPIALTLRHDGSRWLVCGFAEELRIA